jgi:hypothetical protein
MAPYSIWKVPNGNGPFCSCPTLSLSGSIEEILPRYSFDLKRSNNVTLLSALPLSTVEAEIFELAGDVGLI